jgi:hypothetical protein
VQGPETVNVCSLNSPGSKEKFMEKEKLGGNNQFGIQNK